MASAGPWGDSPVLKHIKEFQKQHAAGHLLGLSHAKPGFHVGLDPASGPSQSKLMLLHPNGKVDYLDDLSPEDRAEILKNGWHEAVAKKIFPAKTISVGPKTTANGGVLAWAALQPGGGASALLNATIHEVGHELGFPDVPEDYPIPEPLDIVHYPPVKCMTSEEAEELQAKLLEDKSKHKMISPWPGDIGEANANGDVFASGSVQFMSTPGSKLNPYFSLSLAASVKHSNQEFKNETQGAFFDSSLGEAHEGSEAKMHLDPDAMKFYQSWIKAKANQGSGKSVADLPENKPSYTPSLTTKIPTNLQDSLKKAEAELTEAQMQQKLNSEAAEPPVNTVNLTQKVFAGFSNEKKLQMLNASWLSHSTKVWLMEGLTHLQEIGTHFQVGEEKMSSMGETAASTGSGLRMPPQFISDSSGNWSVNLAWEKAVTQLHPATGGRKSASNVDWDSIQKDRYKNSQAKLLLPQEYSSDSVFETVRQVVEESLVREREAICQRVSDVMTEQIAEERQKWQQAHNSVATELHAVKQDLKQQIISALSLAGSAKSEVSNLKETLDYALDELDVAGKKLKEANAEVKRLKAENHNLRLQGPFGKVSRKVRMD